MAVICALSPGKKSSPCIAIDTFMLLPSFDVSRETMLQSDVSLPTPVIVALSPTERYSLFLLSVVVVKKSPLCSSLMTTAAVSVVFCPVSTHTFVIIPKDGAVISPFCCFRVFSFSNCFWNCSKEMALISCV